MATKKNTTKKQTAKETKAREHKSSLFDLKGQAINKLSDIEDMCEGIAMAAHGADIGDRDEARALIALAYAAKAMVEEMEDIFRKLTTDY